MRVKNLIFLLLAGSRVMAQDQYSGDIPVARPVTPNSAALFKAEQRPVGSYTGTTPINIPLYNLTAGDLQVPVNLNYHNGGIKVEEVAGWVGLGWSLSAGGRITRAVNGTPDDIGGYGGFLHSDLPPSQFPGNPWLPNIDAILRQYLDVEPDLYYFEFNGLSGKFYFSEEGVIHLVDQMPIQIEPVWQFVPPQSGNQIKGWIIKDDQGRKYYFGMNKAQTETYIDYTNTSYSSLSGYTNTPPPLAYSSAWHLVEMYDMTEENVIRFTYENGLSVFKTLSGAYMRISGMTGFDCLPSDSYGDEVLVTTTTGEKILKKITAPNGYLEFFFPEARQDLGGAKLDDIKMFNSNNNPISSYHFNYDYFVSPGALAGNDEFRKRLKLTSLVHYDNSGSNGLTHTFEYIENVNLPSRLSRATDYWGFYNGKTSNWTFLPNGYYEAGIYSSRRSNLADRRAYPAYSVANTLKKITFPTGGHREFIYEGNQALREYSSQVQPDASYYINNYNLDDKQQFDYQNTYFYPNFPVYQKGFTVNSTDGETNFEYFLGGISGTGDFQVKIIGIVGFSEFEVQTFYNQTNADWNLSNGEYRIELYFTFTRDFSNISMYWRDLNLSSEVTYRYGEPYRRSNMNVGGIRVQQVRDYDPVTGMTNTTRYDYTIRSNTSQAGLSSGLLISPVIVAHVGGCQPLNRDCIYIRLSSGSAYPLTSEGGSYVVYPEVQTIEDGNGYLDHEYSFAFDATHSTIDIWDYPIVPFQDQSWKRNKLVVEEVYDEQGTLLKKSRSRGLGVYSSEWGPPNPPDFSAHMAHSQIGWKVVGYYDGHVCSGGLCMGCWNQYSMTSFFTATTDSKEITYTPQGNYESFTEYEYYTDKGQPVLKKEKIHLNNGEIKEINYKYAFNLTSEFEFSLTAPEQQMKDVLFSENYLQPLEITVYLIRDGQPFFLEGSKHTFNYFNTAKKHLAVIKRYTTLTDYTEINLSEYDTNGNLTEVYKTDDVKEAYLWGYKGQYLVAKVVGSDYSTISGYVNNSILQNPSTDQQLRNELNKIRTGLANTTAQVITYTYDPLVGMTSQTDPNGETVHYTYDDFNRLKLIKNNDLNILQSYLYHYKGM